MDKIRIVEINNLNKIIKESSNLAQASNVPDPPSLDHNS